MIKLFVRATIPIAPPKKVPGQPYCFSAIVLIYCKQICKYIVNKYIEDEEGEDLIEGAKSLLQFFHNFSLNCCFVFIPPVCVVSNYMIIFIVIIIVVVINSQKI